MAFQDVGILAVGGVSSFLIALSGVIVSFIFEVITGYSGLAFQFVAAVGTFLPFSYFFKEYDIRKKCSATLINFINGTFLLRVLAYMILFIITLGHHDSGTISKYTGKSKQDSQYVLEDLSELGPFLFELIMLFVSLSCFLYYAFIIELVVIAVVWVSVQVWKQPGDPKQTLGN